MKSFKSQFFSFKFILVLSVLVSFLYLNIDTTAIDQATYRKQQAQINSQVDSVKTNIKEINKSFEDVSQQASTLEGEITRMQEEIVKSEQIIKDSEDLISKLQLQITINNENVEKLKDQIKELLKEIQRNNKVSPIQNILSSRNFGEALSKMYSLSSLQNKTDELKTDLETQTNQLKDNKKNQEEVKDDALKQKELLQSKKDSLRYLLDTYRGKEAEYAKQIAVLKQQQIDLNSKSAKLEADFNSQPPAPRNNGGGNTGGGNSGGGGGSQPPGYTRGKCWFEDGGDPGLSGFFIKPTGANSRPNDNFGCPSWYGRSHDGVDLSGSIGNPIFAAAGGTVNEVNASPFNGTGFGRYIILKHTLPSGARVYSLYAHLNSVNVSNGAGVSQGQVIGTLGMSGNVTGPHLHFMLINQSFETTRNPGCNYGNSKCYDPFRFILL